MNTHLVPRSRLLQLFLPAVLCLVLALSAAVSAEDCGSFKTCDACTNESSGLNCSWVKCDDGPSCVNSNLPSANCSIVNCTEANTTVSTPTTVPSSHSTTTTAVVPTALPKKGTFDAASFIGGVVLVLGVQAVVFFVYKFCKAKERNYHTL